LLSLPAALIAHIEGGGTLVTASRQRAAAVRLAHSARMLAQGLTLWASPDILPWGAWVERELEQARVHGEAVPRRLSSAEQWQLWREAVLQSAAGLQILAPERLIDPVRRAAGILDDYGLCLSAADSPEAALLIAAQAAYRRHCTESGAMGSDSWLDCRDYLHPSAQLMLAGFSGQMGPARRRWLEQHDAQICEADVLDWPACELQVSAQPSPAGEAQAAAAWCAEQLRVDPTARLLLVVPRLAQQRQHWMRALSQQLDAPRILSADDPAGAAERAPYVIEGGRALAEHPLVSTALALIALGAGTTSIEQLGALLRSAYLPKGNSNARLRLELWLRERGLDPPTLDGLCNQGARIASEAGEECAALIQALQGALSVPEPAPQSWAECFAIWLEQCGWPGESLGSDEQQTRQRMDALLGELAALDQPERRLSLQAAVALLRERVSREHFEPASDDVAVTVTASLDDPLVRYDGIWVAGLSADSWPGPARTDPLIPAQLQRAAALPGSTPGLQLAEARRLQGLWSRRARAGVLSWAPPEEDLPSEASPLLMGLAEAGRAAPFRLTDWVADLQVPLQRWQELRGAPWPSTGRLKGGARLLELQSLCPFRGYAELRLAAGELAAAERGVAARERGRILHRALELFWRHVQVSEALQDDAAELGQLAERCASQAVAEATLTGAGPLASLLLERERERTYALLLRLIEWERARAPFVAQALESGVTLQLAGHDLPLRVDRIDRLQDGRLLILDYKSGKPQPFDAYGERPSQPQLAAYALAFGAEVAGVAMLYFGAPKLGVRGVADREGRLAKLAGVAKVAAAPAGLAWQTLQGQWRERLLGLAREFLAGHAAVEPQPRACERCRLQILCRIDERQMESLRATREAEADTPGAAEETAAEEDIDE
jgi:probable DNA repair protein